MKEWMRRYLAGEVDLGRYIEPPGIEPVVDAGEWNAAANFEALRGAIGRDLSQLMEALKSLSFTRDGQRCEFSVVATNSENANDAFAESGKMYFGFRISGVISAFFRIELGSRGFVIRYEVFGRDHDVVVIPLTELPLRHLRQTFATFLQEIGQLLREKDITVAR